MLPFCRLSKAAQAAMKEVAAGSALIEMLSLDGTWIRSGEPSWYNGSTYRVSPSWPGPAKPEPVVEYIDKPVVLDGVVYLFAHYTHNEPQWILPMACGIVGFAGYVYLDGFGVERCRARLLFDSLPDGTYRLRVPKAVRFVKQ
jgi:hypothetical protein